MIVSRFFDALKATRSPHLALLRGAARPSGLEGDAYEVTGPRHEWLGFVWQSDDGWRAGRAICKDGAPFATRTGAARSLR
ncbi:hypothetical protein [Sphingomicrobium marinum]|uniref:hypothetical protein n=1 Tax=Sphingomicrobium marinum TaxID=1227950 RepID=UPI0022400A00|nr:hypothetical protein [Sphingomicrobium marinum]